MEIKGSFIVAAKEYFGLRPSGGDGKGQDLRGFAAELKSFSHQDRADVAYGLFTAGALTEAGYKKELDLLKAKVAKEAEDSGTGPCDIEPHKSYEFKEKGGK